MDVRSRTQLSLFEDSLGDEIIQQTWISRIPPCPGHALVCSLLSDLHPPQSEQTAPRSIASRNVRETMSAVGYRIYKNRDPRLRISVLGRSIQASA